MAAAVSQHGEVSGHADSHVAAVDSGLLITFLFCDSAFYATRRCPQTKALWNSLSGINSSPSLRILQSYIINFMHVLLITTIQR